VSSNLLLANLNAPLPSLSFHECGESRPGLPAGLMRRSHLGRVLRAEWPKVPVGLGTLLARFRPQGCTAGPKQLPFRSASETTTLFPGHFRYIDWTKARARNHPFYSLTNARMRITEYNAKGGNHG